MKNKNSFCTCFYACASVFLFMKGMTSCTSNYVKEPEPLWASYSTIEDIYPNSKFIARIGYSYDENGAEILAESELLSYFPHTVHSIVQGNQTMEEFGEVNTNILRKIERNVTVESLQNLFDVYKTKIWFNPSNKQYVCCAYINRTDAWKLYIEKVRDSSNRFINFYNDAEKENEPINRIRLLNDALSAGSIFSDRLEIANSLSEDLTKKTFGKEELILSSIPSFIKKEVVSNPIYINVRNDSAGVVEEAIRESFSNIGFVVTGSATNASYIAKTEVNYNKANGTNMTVLYPFISISLVGKSGSVFSFSLKTEKVIAPTEQAAKKIAAQDIADEINKRLEFNIRKSLGL